MLSRFKVLDLSRVLAGPYCTMLLGDLGAQVIKVEQIGSGDPTRGWGPPFRQTSVENQQSSIYFDSFNRNKRSLAVDFRKENAQKLLHKLVTESDVFVENFIPDTLSKYKLDYQTLKAINPKLIYCSITGYGQDGPLKHVPGYDLIAAARYGLLSITGPLGGEPCRVGVAVTDLTTGLYAKSSILAALLAPERGCHIDVNLMSTQIAMNSHIMAEHMHEKTIPGGIGTGHRNLVPYRAYLASDSKYLIIGIGSDAQFASLAKILDQETNWLPKWAINATRVASRTAVDQAIEQLVKAKPLSHWLDKLNKSGIPHGPVNNMAEVLEDPQVQYHSQRLVLSWPEEHLRVSGSAISFKQGQNCPHQEQSPPPRLGQHSREICLEAGLSQEEIASLVHVNALQME